MAAVDRTKSTALQASPLCYSTAMTRTRAAIAALAILLAAAAVELAMGRPPICTCGRIALWGPAGPTQSQMFADWYSPSHVVHGFLFYLALWLIARKRPVEWRFLVALIVEVAWEMFENTPMVINRYRTVTVSLGYLGDSTFNSLSDVLMMAFGFIAARKLPLWGSILAVLALELIPLIIIRDNLTLNIWMFLWPDKHIIAWQSRG
jgi:hypothetical protein